MIIVKLIGGLANQMFPYAAARSLACRQNTKLKLDITGFLEYKNSKDFSFRRYSLGAFNILEDFADQEEILSLSTRERRFYEKIINKKNVRPKTYYKEKFFHYDPSFLEIKGDVYLSGNWNSYKYFEGIDEIIRKDFSFKIRPSFENYKIIDMMRSCESVSLHVRRGDYVKNVKTNELHGICDVSYYNNCVEYLKNKIKNIKYFIFSDDMSWVKRNLRIDGNVFYVENNDVLSGVEDLRLMTFCKHNIIANSGFSWWGAYLNNNSNKIVMAPKKWFNYDDINTSDLIPEKWIRI